MTMKKYFTFRNCLTVFLTFAFLGLAGCGANAPTPTAAPVPPTAQTVPGNSTTPIVAPTEPPAAETPDAVAAGFAPKYGTFLVIGDDDAPIIVTDYQIKAGVPLTQGAKAVLFKSGKDTKWHGWFVPDSGAKRIKLATPNKADSYLKYCLDDVCTWKDVKKLQLYSAMSLTENGKANADKWIALLESHDVCFHTGESFGSPIWCAPAKVQTIAKDPVPTPVTIGKDLSFTINKPQVKKSLNGIAVNVDNLLLFMSNGDVYLRDAKPSTVTTISTTVAVKAVVWFDNDHPGTIQMAVFPEGTNKFIYDGRNIKYGIGTIDPGTVYKTLKTSLSDKTFAAALDAVIVDWYTNHYCKGPSLILSPAYTCRPSN
jgi:hypothetical protein